MAFFEGLVLTEDGTPLSVTHVGTTPYYVVDDQGFRRHIEARPLDRQVLRQFQEQLNAHRDEATAAMLLHLGKDDLFTKAMVDSTLRNLNLEQVLDQGLPASARQWLALLGFRVVINLHGELVRLEMPSVADGGEEER